MDNNDPAVLFYTSDFLTGVMDMDMAERGQYITLLCYQHQKGHISDKTIRLLVGNVSVSVLEHFKIDENGLYYNRRMDEEKLKRATFTCSRRENGKLGGRPRKPSAKPNGEPSIKPKLKHMGNDNDNDNDILNNNIYEYIEHEFGRVLSSAEYEVIETWEDNDLTKYAVKQAILNGVRTIKYISAILDNYRVNGIKTQEEAALQNKNKKKGKSLENQLEKLKGELK